MKNVDVNSVDCCGLRIDISLTFHRIDYEFNMNGYGDGSPLLSLVKTC